MTAYSVTRPEDQDRTGGVVVEIPTVAELRLENEHLKELLDETRRARDAATAGWLDAVNARIVDRQRLSTAARVLSSIERFSPVVAGLVAAARREIWRLDR